MEDTVSVTSAWIVMSMPYATMAVVNADRATKEVDFMEIVNQCLSVTPVR